MTKRYRGPGCCYRFLRRIVIATQLVYLVLGGLVAGLGVYAMSGYSAVVAGTQLMYGVVILGVFISVIALIGALSAWRSFRFGLLLNLICLSMFMIILIALGIAVYVKRNDSEELIDRGWSELGVETRTTIQNEFGCCGSYGVNATKPDGFGGPCPEVEVDGVLTNETVEGCVPLLSSKLRENLGSAALAGIIVAVTLLFGVGSVIMLRSSIAADAEAREEDRYEREQEKRMERRMGERERLRERTNDRIGDIRAKYQSKPAAESSAPAPASSSSSASSYSSASSSASSSSASSSRDYNSMRSTPSRSAAMDREPDIEAPPTRGSVSSSSASRREPPVRTSRSRGAASDTYRLLD